MTEAHPRSGLQRYLEVRYAASRRPYTTYPDQLARYLSEQYLRDFCGGRLLDLGCGRGEFLEGFARLGFQASGVERCQPPREVSAPVAIRDFERDGLPFADGELDVVFSKSVLEHLHDLSGVLAECRRVLRPGGRMIHLVPDWRAQWRHFYDDWTHVRPFTLVGVREAVQSHGFAVAHAQRFRQLPLLWRYPALSPLAGACALLPAALKRHSKFVRFSQEWMLLVVAERPRNGRSSCAGHV